MGTNSGMVQVVDCRRYLAVGGMYGPEASTAASHAV